MLFEEGADIIHAEEPKGSLVALETEEADSYEANSVAKKWTQATTTARLSLRPGADAP